MSSPPEIPSYLQAYIDQAVAMSTNNSWSFTQGLILGQATVLLLVLAFVKYMLLEDIKTTKQQRPLPLPTPLNAKTASTPPASVILLKTLYDPVLHSPEPTDWLNVLIGQAIYQFRDDAQVNNRLARHVDEALNGGIKPDFVGSIHVTRLHLGEEYPMFNNARIRSADNIGRMRVEIDCDYNDQITLGIDTQIVINWPRPGIAVLPISLVLSVVKFSATISLEIVNATQSSYIAISALPDFILEFDVKSLIGSRSKLEGVPKVTNLITSKLRNLFLDRFVFPNFKKFEIPNFLDGDGHTTKEKESESATTKIANATLLPSSVDPTQKNELIDTKTKQEDIGRS